jgi:CRP/FNR family cyclic AMP-dependent transcriptional regulator
MAIIDSLKGSDLFKEMDEARLQKVAHFCRGQSFQRGSTVFKEGDDATELFLLTEGRIVLEMDVSTPGQQPLPTGMEIVNPGEVFGWSAVVEPNVYKLTARCMTNCNALAMKGEMLKKAMNQDTGLGYHMMKKLSEIIALRLTYTRLRLSSGFGIPLSGRELETPKRK